MVIDPVDLILSKLEAVRPAGSDHTARCPAHADRTASLSIGRSAQGSALLKCFAGCDTAAVLSAIGLTLADLFPERPRMENADRPPRDNPQSRFHAAQERARIHREMNWAAALPVLSYQAAVVMIAARQLRTGELLTDEDQGALEHAEALISEARELLVPPPPPKWNLAAGHLVHDDASQRALPKGNKHGR